MGRPWMPRDLEHPPGTQSKDEREARWKRFRWNQLLRLSEKIGMLPFDGELSKRLQARLQKLQSME